MSNTAVILKPIHELFSEHFFLTDYQKGDSWERWQVKELLNDILGFCDKENRADNESYYFQPIVLNTREAGWEMLDGKQRLMTIFLIMEYLNRRYSKKFRREVFTLEYRHSSARTEYLLSLGNKKADYFEFMNMYESFDEIKKWFENHMIRINGFESIFLFKVQLLWCELNVTIDAESAFSPHHIS